MLVNIDRLAYQSFYSCLLSPLLLHWSTDSEFRTKLQVSTLNGCTWSDHQEQEKAKNYGTYWQLLFLLLQLVSVKRGRLTLRELGTSLLYMLDSYCSPLSLVLLSLPCRRYVIEHDWTIVIPCCTLFAIYLIILSYIKLKY